LNGSEPDIYLEAHRNITKKKAGLRRTVLQLKQERGISVIQGQISIRSLTRTNIAHVLGDESKSRVKLSP
jgi:hypothetical protein